MKVWFLSLIRNVIPDEWVVDCYKEVASEYGDALSYSYLGTPIGIDILEHEYFIWKNELEVRHYIPYNEDELIRVGGYGADIPISKERQDLNEKI